MQMPPRRSLLGCVSTTNCHFEERFPITPNDYQLKSMQMLPARSSLSCVLTTNCHFEEGFCINPNDYHLKSIYRCFQGDRLYSDDI